MKHFDFITGTKVGRIKKFSPIAISILLSNFFCIDSRKTTICFFAFCFVLCSRGVSLEFQYNEVYILTLGSSVGPSTKYGMAFICFLLGKNVFLLDRNVRPNK